MRYLWNFFISKIHILKNFYENLRSLGRASVSHFPDRALINRFFDFVSNFRKNTAENTTKFSGNQPEILPN